MCLTCGCNEPLNDHGDDRNITLQDFGQAANAAGISIVQAIINAVKCLTALTIEYVLNEQSYQDAMKEDKTEPSVAQG